MTKSELFNKVVNHLAQQGRPAYDAHSRSCRYRLSRPCGPDLACGIGGLIPDEKYSPHMEGKLVRYAGVLAAAGIPMELEEMAQALQRAHDVSAELGVNPASALVMVAERFGLPVYDMDDHKAKFANWQAA